jgi:molecular chaperone Hsp33
MADKLIRAIAANGGIRAVGAITTRLTEEARGRHRLSYVATAALGRAMTAGLLLSSNMKTENSRIELRFRGNGPMGGMLVDAGVNGMVRGFVNNPTVELPPNSKGKLDVGGALGSEGYLYVVRDFGFGYPSSSTVALVSGEVGDDVTSYLLNSEQTPSALMVGVFVGERGVDAAGGILIQVLPQAERDEALISLLESRISALTGFTPLLQAGKTLPDILTDILGDLGLEIFPEVQMLKFQCRCSNERVLGALKLLGTAELEDMIKVDRGAEVTCDFCAEVYRASELELGALVHELNSAASL